MRRRVKTRYTETGPKPYISIYGNKAKTVKKKFSVKRAFSAFTDLKNGFFDFDQGFLYDSWRFFSS
jgi:hypothetical protein